MIKIIQKWLAFYWATMYMVTVITAIRYCHNVHYL